MSVKSDRIALYNKLFSEQKGRCAICGCHQSEGKWKFNLDHCHVIGVVRGLLCPSCYMGLGYWADDDVRLLKAVIYLRRNRSLNIEDVEALLKNLE